MRPIARLSIPSWPPTSGRTRRASTAAASAYLQEPSAQHATALATAAEPPRQELLRRMNMAPGATAALIGDSQGSAWLVRAAEPALRPFKSDLHHVLAAWFNRGFLKSRRIDWNTPAVILEKLIAYEAVHEIEGWKDYAAGWARIAAASASSIRRLPGEPLIFVEVALVKGMAGAIAPLLDRNAADKRDGREWDTAIFYSISNCQEGLRGISFGNFLIKQVVEELKTESARASNTSPLCYSRSPVSRNGSWPA